ncbi:MAG: NUDIX domain-containing protein [Caulobacteraceae bacterium]|nr:NUDIX domain-containing protein [Caulobacteraceae bacterium]
MMKKEWRLSQRKEVLEFASGRIEPNESPHSCAVRELEEELGVHAGTMLPLGSYSLWNHSSVAVHFSRLQNRVSAENPMSMK